MGGSAAAVAPTLSAQSSRSTRAPQGKTRTLKGTVLDDEGLPLIAAGVINQDTKDGVVTDLNGIFSIKVSASQNAVLLVSYLGYEEEKVVVKPEDNDIKVTLKSNTKLEGAVISAGYGVIQKRENFAGSAYQMTSTELKVRPHDRLDNMLAGMVPGMMVSESSTNGARSSIKIRIRGDGSLSASNEPLWVIDGVPVYTGSNTGAVAGTSATVSPLSYINPDDIEDITVLKDATTTTLYGADGANGVILVTTRNASAGKNKFNVSVQYGIDNIDKTTKIKYLKTKDWWTIAQEAWTNSGRNLAYFPYLDNERQTFSNVDTDWFDVYVGTGSTFEANFSVTGGTEKMKHYFSAGVYSFKSPYIGNSQNRYSLREKTDLIISRHFQANVQFSGTFSHSDIFSISGFNNYLSIFSPWNEDGSYRLYNYYNNSEDSIDIRQRNFVYNKLPEREYDDHYQNANTMEAAVALKYIPFKGLTITSLSTANFQNIYEATYASRRSRSGINSEDSSLSGYTGRYGVFDLGFQEDFRANYRHLFGVKHDVSAVAGIVFTDRTHPYLQASGNGFANDYIKEIAYAEASTRKGTSNTSHSRSLSYLANASYTYDNKYTLTFTGRRQGNSAFSYFSQWRTYYAVAGRWNVHREAFYNIPWMNQCSLRMSYGVNGNSRVDSSSSYGSYSLSGTYGGRAAATQASPANPGLSWETTYITNPGINMGFLDGRLSIDIDYYNRQTHDIIYSGRVSSVITDGTVKRNVGIIENRGWEFAINTVNVNNPNFSWRTYINGARNRNLIKKLEGDSYTGFFDHIWIEGQQKDAMWLIDFAGIDPTNGKRMYYDANGDLTYTANFADRVYMPQYSNQPDLFGGVSNQFTFGKHWSAQIMFDYTLGGWYFYTLIYDASSIDHNLPVEYLDRWTTPGVAATIPRIEYKNGNTLADYNTPYDLWNMTSVQLRSVSVSYSLPNVIAKKMGVDGCSFSFIGRNLYLWTLGQNAHRNSYKTVRDPYGMHRTFSLSANISF